MIKYAYWKRIIFGILLRYFFECYSFLHPVLDCLKSLQLKPEYQIPLALNSSWYKAAWKKLSSPNFMIVTVEDFINGGNLSKSSQANAKVLEAEWARAYQHVLVQMNHTDDTEHQLGVESHLTLDDPHYVDALTYVNNWTFLCAVEHLEGLVVQRLFELSKANLATTGEYLVWCL